MGPSGANTSIVALSTPVGVGGIAVIRISGPLAREIACRITRLPQKRFRHRYAVFASIADHEASEIDRGLVTFFKGPHSYTGEDVLEISTHGGAIIPQRVIESCLYLGCKPADPGEFTYRAFLNGKMDLSQAEAVCDVIAAKTRLSQKISHRILAGSFSSLIHRMKEDLLTLVSVVEAELDFSQDELPLTSLEEKESLLDGVLATATALLGTYTTGRLATHGATVSIIGRPNVGKSSLLNAIIAQERVIVHEMPGTTRDAVEVSYQLDGFPIRFIDTAGLRSSTHPVERRGIEFSREYIRKSDLVLWVFEITDPVASIAGDISTPFFNAPFLLVLNKADTIDGRSPHRAPRNGLPVNPLIVSALKATGLRNLTRAVLDTLVPSPITDQEVLLTNARHKRAIQEAVSSLKSGRTLLASGEELAVVASEIRQALFHLDQILGITTADDILENIFSRFCVGK